MDKNSKIVEIDSERFPLTANYQLAYKKVDSNGREKWELGAEKSNFKEALKDYERAVSLYGTMNVKLLTEVLAEVSTTCEPRFVDEMKVWAKD